MLSKKIISSIPPAIRTIRRISASSLGSEITFHQFRVLNLVFEGMNQTQMSQNLQVSMAAVSKIVDLLVKKDLLNREACEDRRCVKLSLTREGEKLRKHVRTSVQKELEKHFKKLTTKEQTDLNNGLDVLDKLMGFLNEK